MAFNGSGVFQRLYSWVADRDAAVDILADRHDAEDNGFAKAINDIVDGTQGFINYVRTALGTAGAPAFSFTGDTDTGIYSPGANQVTVSVGGLDAVKVDASRNLDLFGNLLVGANGGYSATGAHGGMTFSAGGQNTLRLSQDSDVASFVQAFYNTNGLVGSIQTSGSATTFNTTSDMRLKEDARTFDGLGMVRNMAVYDYKWTTCEDRAYGVFAQELYPICPSAVTVGDDDTSFSAKDLGDREPWAVDYSKIVPVLLRAVQQLEQENADLSVRISILESPSL